MTPPKTAVLGAAGFLGRYLLEFYRGFYPDCAATDLAGRLGLAKLDLASPDISGLRLAATGHAYAVIAAAVARPELVERDPAYARKRNVDGTLKLAKRLAGEGVVPVFISTDYVFDGEAGGYVEDSPVRPLNEYGRQKAEVERALPEATGGRCLILRPGKLFGLKKGDGTLLDEMAARLSCGQSVRAATDQVFCPTLVGDFLAALAALQSAGATGLFHACSPERWTRFDLARAMAKALGVEEAKVAPISLDDLEERLRRPKRTWLRSDKLSKTAPVRFASTSGCVETVAAGYRRAAEARPGWKTLSDEVFFPDKPVAAVAREELEFLKRRAAANPRGRARLCGHRSEEDPVHEMIIALSGRGYVQPHKHLRRVESYHVIEGRARFIRFDDQGGILEVIELGDPASGRTFYLRDAGASFHTLIVESDHLLFHETTRGPFRRGETLFAPWAPQERRADEVREFQRRLAEQVARFTGASAKP